MSVTVVGLALVTGPWWMRLMTQLARQFEEHPEVRYGLTAMCIGIGMGGAVIWENPHHAEYGKETAA
jgi:acetyl-CoA acyltransferase